MEFDAHDVVSSNKATSDLQLAVLTVVRKRFGGGDQDTHDILDCRNHLVAAKEVVELQVRR